MEQCISDMRKWLRSNLLKLNEDKTEIMIVGQPHNIRKLGNVCLTIGDAIIEPSSSVRNIGAVIDSQMQMLEQVNSICRSCYSSLYSISRVRKYLTTEATQTLVHAFISCRLDNFNSLLSGVPQYMLAKLQLVQNNAARIIVRKRKSDHISLTLKELHWLPIEARVEFKILLLTFKALNGTAPLYLSNLVKIKENACVLLSGSEQYLEVPPTRLTSIGDRAFAAIAPRLWNRIPITIRNSANVNIFKRAVKTPSF